jgi:hypothetical protein
LIARLNFQSARSLHVAEFSVGVNIDRFEGILALDFKSKTLVDESASPDQRIIAGPPRTTKFFSWAAGHRSNIESLRVIQSLVDPTRRFRNQ